MDDDRSGFAPGDWVTLAGHDDWGLGQVQSAVGPRVTVMFANKGKVVLNITVAALLPLPAPSAGA